MAEVIGNSVTAPTATLASEVNTSMTSATVNGWASPLPQTGTFRVLIDNELIEVGTVTGATLGSLVRGAESTTATSHNAGAEVNLVLTAGGLAAYVSQSGGSTPGAAIVRKFPFTYATADLATGAAIYTPTAGDVLLDAWVEIDTVWNGTTPTLDFGTFLDGANYGLFDYLLNGDSGVDMTVADTYTDNNGSHLGLLVGSQASSLRDFIAMQLAVQMLNVSVTSLQFAPSGTPDFTRGDRILPLKFPTDAPIQVVVSQNGQNNGGDPGATQGAAVLYLVTATPA